MAQIFLTSGTTWTVPEDWNSSSNTVELLGAGGGGGGAGGSALIKAQTVAFGSALVTAAAGTGGGTQSGGGNGSVGRIHLDYLTSYTGTTNPTLDARLDTSLTLSGSSGGAFLMNML